MMACFALSDLIGGLANRLDLKAAPLRQDETSTALYTFPSLFILSTAWIFEHTITVSRSIV